MTNLNKSVTAIIIVATLLAEATIYGQTSPHESARHTALVLDAAKPYVYLQVDRVGPRAPLRDGEKDSGIWLTLINNSTQGIVVIGISKDRANDTKVESISDEVVPDQGTELMGLSQSVGNPQHLNTEGLFAFPNFNEENAREAARNNPIVNTRPRGYGYYTAPGYVKFVLIQSGEKLSFSLPVDHVSGMWHLEIPFRFYVDGTKHMREPYSYVALYWNDLPQDYQNAHPVPRFVGGP